MLFTELAKMVHENAMEHGWWDKERKPAETLALIHSEWSEALEEARAGRPMVYHECNAGTDEWDCDGHPSVELNNVCTQCAYKKCNYRKQKPEGIAVELIDGCIRILDYVGKLNAQADTFRKVAVEDLYVTATDKLPETLPELVAQLHLHTAEVLRLKDDCPAAARSFGLLMPFALAMSWVKNQGMDPMEILLEKHLYNKTRPYKHGKRF